MDVIQKNLMSGLDVDYSYPGTTNSTSSERIMKIILLMGT